MPGTIFNMNTFQCFASGHLGEVSRQMLALESRPHVVFFFPPFFPEAFVGWKMTFSHFISPDEKDIHSSIFTLTSRRVFLSLRLTVVLLCIT